MSKLVARLGVPALAVLALAGCGSSSSTQHDIVRDDVHVAPRAAPTHRVAAQVPAAIKSKGTLTVAADAQLRAERVHRPRRSHRDRDGRRPDEGARRSDGPEGEHRQRDLRNDHPRASPPGKYDIGASSFTDTKEREKTVDFVDYFNAGISFYAKASANPAVKTVADLCGKTVSVEKGTTEQEEAEAQSKKCTKEGKKAVTVLSFPDQNGANLAISSGRAELGMADSPVAAYQVKQSSGAFKLDRRNLRHRPLRARDPEGQRA